MAEIVGELQQFATLSSAGLRFMATNAGMNAAVYERKELVDALRLRRLNQLSLAEFQASAEWLGVDTSECPDRGDATSEIMQALWKRNRSQENSQSNATTEDSSGQDICGPRVTFQKGDSAIRKGEQCKIVWIDKDADCCTVCMDTDGRIVDTLLKHLRPLYPSKVHDNNCPICLRPVSGTNCVPCCMSCEESKWLHRQCLLNLVCNITCLEGHQLREADCVERAIGEFQCGQCNEIRKPAADENIVWHCPECDWNVCRKCIEQSLASVVPCPTCRRTLPFSGADVEDNLHRPQPFVIDELGICHGRKKRGFARSVDALDCLFKKHHRASASGRRQLFSTL